MEAATEALSDMPPRGEEELDPVTLHNQVQLIQIPSPLCCCLLCFALHCPTAIIACLDSVVLNQLVSQALMNMGDDPTTGFKKMSYLLSMPPFPPETFGNLLLLYCKYGYYDLAADVLAENAHLTFKYLSQELFEYLDATIITVVSLSLSLHSVCLSSVRPRIMDSNN